MDNQFVISPELLHILKWMVDHELDSLKKIIKRILKKSMNSQSSKLQVNDMNTDNFEIQEDMQQSVIDFFLMLEALIDESLQEQEVNNIIQRDLMPSIDKIDISTCGAQTLANSIAKAASTCEDKPNKNPKNILCKELLKHWKPSKTTTYN